MASTKVPLNFKLEVENEILIKASQLYREKIKSIHHDLHNEKCMTGWINQPTNLNVGDIETIKMVAEEIQQRADVLIVVGIGGSYLGAKAIYEALTPYFKDEHDYPTVIFAGYNLSASYLQQLLAYLKDKEFYVNIISKSGTTIEPAITFRLLHDFMEKRYGDAMKERIIVTTNPVKGTLKELSDIKGFRTLDIPDDIGGRYSVFTPVGLLPLAAAGLDFENLLKGAQMALCEFMQDEIEENYAYQYAAVRQYLYSLHYKIELLTTSEPSLSYLHEWWKQLYGESEGKNGKGIFPASASYSTDLHSFGQYIQEGDPILFETIVEFSQPSEDVLIPFLVGNVDNMNFVSGKTIHEINCIATESAALAHQDAGVPVIRMKLDSLNEFTLGYLMYFFMKACAISACLSGVNPFDQPGVEAYKLHMKRLLNQHSLEVTATR